MVVFLNAQILEVESCAHIYVTATAPTTLTTSGTYYKLLGTTAVYNASLDFITSNNRITYIGDRTRFFDIIVPFSMSSDKKDIDVTFEIFKNGDGEIIASRINRTLRTVGDIYVMALACIVELAKDDYIELWASANADSVIVTLQTMSFLVCS